MLDLPGTGTEYTRDSPATVSEINDDLRKRFAPNGSTGPHDDRRCRSAAWVAPLDGARYPATFTKQW
jgi:hypothetical protein